MQEALRKGGKECPACRTECRTRRSLRLNPSFDELLATLYPQLSEVRDAEEERIAEILREKCPNLVVDSGPMDESEISGRRTEYSASSRRNAAGGDPRMWIRSSRYQRRVEPDSVCFVGFCPFSGASKG